MQTIHAFCTRLLHQFPFEANVAARFTVLDEASTTQLLDQLTLEVLLEASAKPDSALGLALATAIVVAADQTFKDVIGDAIRKRDAIDAWIARAGSVDKAIAELSKAFGIAPTDTPEVGRARILFAVADPGGGMAGADRDSRFRLGHRQEAHRRARSRAHRVGRERIDNYLKVFCTAELEPRKNIVTKKIADKHPDWLARLIAEQERVCKLLERERALAARERTRALVTIAADVIARYRAKRNAARCSTTTT